MDTFSWTVLPTVEVDREKIIELLAKSHNVSISQSCNLFSSYSTARKVFHFFYITFFISIKIEVSLLNIAKLNIILLSLM